MNQKGYSELKSDYPVDAVPTKMPELFNLHQQFANALCSLEGDLQSIHEQIYRITGISRVPPPTPETTTNSPAQLSFLDAMYAALRRLDDIVVSTESVKNAMSELI